jgi:HD superfamily phosphohydrolase YqeK
MTGLPPWAEVTPERREHVERVAALINIWATAMNVGAEERGRWLRAAYLHDALRDAPVEKLARLATARWGNPELLHGPAAAALAAQQGETDPGVLSAVRYHSVGYARWDSAGRMLYLADYLEPGRAFRADERRALAGRVPSDPAGVLRAVATQRLIWTVSSGWPLVPETVEFWNEIARAA